MNDVEPPRLLSSLGSSWEHDPTDAELERLTARLAPVLSPSNPPPPPPPPPVAPAMPLKSSVVPAKTLMATSGAALIVLAAILFLRTPTAVPMKLARFDAPVLRIEAPSKTPVAEPTPIVVEQEAEPKPTAHAAAPTPRPSAEPEIAAPAAAPIDEAELLTRAHVALQSGDAAKALELCAVHEKLPGTKLGQERERIAIEALLRAGRRGAATERAERFLTRYPSSSYRRRIETLLSPSPDTFDHKR